jgi:hypothetical protein
MTRALELSDDSPGTGGEQGIAECTVFSGQNATHTIHLRNSSDTIGIRHVRIEIQQPEVRGGPALIELLAALEGERGGGEDEPSMESEESQKSPTMSSQRRHSSIINHVAHLDPYEGKEVRIRVFGIDPSAAAAAARGNDREDTAKGTGYLEF